MISEFEMGLLELHEACVQAEIDFHLGCASMLNEYVLNEDGDSKSKGIRAIIDAIRKMVYSFSDFIKGSVSTLCDKLRGIPDLARTGLDLGRRADTAWTQVSNYWSELKNTTSDKDYGEGKINAIKNKIADIIAKFKKICRDVSFKLRTFADKMRSKGAFDSMNKSFKKGDKDKALKAGERVIDYADTFDRRMDSRRADSKRAEAEKERRRIAKQKAKDLMDNIRNNSQKPRIG